MKVRRPECKRERWPRPDYRAIYGIPRWLSFTHATNYKMNIYHYTRTTSTSGDTAGRNFIFHIPLRREKYYNSTEDIVGKIFRSLDLNFKRKRRRLKWVFNTERKLSRSKDKNYTITSIYSGKDSKTQHHSWYNKILKKTDMEEVFLNSV